MVIKTVRILLFFLLLFLCPVQESGAQQEDSPVPLVKLLRQLQKDYGVEFNYALDNVQGIRISPPKKDLTIDEILTELTELTGLEFEQISDLVILVKRPDELILCGYLKDQETQTLLTSATIMAGSNSSVSDDNGFFRIRVISPDENITVRHLGYKTIAKQASDFKMDACGDIFLMPYWEALEEVVISNYIVPGVDKLNSGDFVLNIPKYKMLPGLIDADVLQSVQAFPGIMSVNETVSNINIRGGTHDQNLILWDGIKMYQSGHFFGLISMYNPRITDRVLLTKNGTEASLTDGVSGSISMLTSRDINNDFKAVVGLNLIDFNAFVDVPVGRSSSFQLAARKAISDLVETPTYDRFFDRIEQDTEVAANQANVINSDKTFDFYDTSLRWLSRISEKDELRLNFIMVANELKFTESAQLNEMTSSRTSSLDQNSIAGGIAYKRRWSDKWQTDLEVFETDYKLKAINVNVLDSQRFLQENKVSETSAKLYTTHNLNPVINIKGGYHFVETEVTNLDDVDNPLFRLLISEVVRTHAGFVQLDWKGNGGDTHLRVGGRYTFIDKFRKSLVEPRLTFSQRFLDFFTFEIKGEMKHQNTSQVINFQNDFLGIEKRRWQLSDEQEIPVLQSKQLSTGLMFERDGWLIDAVGYYKEIDGITAQSQGFQNQYEFTKTAGSYEVAGLDLLFRKQFRDLSTWVSYSLMDNKYTFETLEPDPFRSNYDINHALTAGFSWKWNDLQLAAGVNWHSGKPTTRPVQDLEIVDEDINFGPTNQEDLDDYLRLDASAMYDLKMGAHAKAKVGVSVWNILDKENSINNFYRIDGESVNESVQRSLGITPNAVFRVYF